jgi:hypothetical protein
MNTPSPIPAQTAAFENLLAYGIDAESMTEKQFNSAALAASNDFWNLDRSITELEQELKKLKKQMTDAAKVHDLFSELGDWWS